jgi:hypothetical protein
MLRRADLGTVGEFLGDFVGTLPQVSFGSFRLDVETRQLLTDSDSRPVHLSPKAFDLLCVLVENRPKAISKPDLHERLWPSTLWRMRRWRASCASCGKRSTTTIGPRASSEPSTATGMPFQARFTRLVHGLGAEHTLGRLQWRREARPGEHVIGRDADVTISLKSPTVSRHHAKIVIAGEVATLEDPEARTARTFAEWPSRHQRSWRMAINCELARSSSHSERLVRRARRRR